MVVRFGVLSANRREAAVNSKGIAYIVVLLLASSISHSQTVSAPASCGECADDLADRWPMLWSEPRPTTPPFRRRSPSSDWRARTLCRRAPPYCPAWITTTAFFTRRATARRRGASSPITAVHEYISQGVVQQSIGLGLMADYRRSPCCPGADARRKAEIAARGLTVTVVQAYYGLQAAEAEDGEYAGGVRRGATTF